MLTGDTRPLLPVGYWTYAAVANAAYAGRHGYEFRYCRWTGTARSPDGVDRAPQWFKFAALWRALEEGYDRVLWIDSDALACGVPSLPLEACLPPRTPRCALVALTNEPFCSPPYNDPCVACSGIFVVYNSKAAREILMEMWHDEGHARKYPFDQGALCAALARHGPDAIVVSPMLSLVLHSMPPPTQLFAHVTNIVTNRADAIRSLYARLGLGAVEVRAAELLASDAVERGAQPALQAQAMVLRMRGTRDEEELNTR